MTRRRIILAVSLLIAAASARTDGGAELGHANLQVMTDEPWSAAPDVQAIGQLPDGRMLIGSSTGVLIHDGHGTAMIPFPRPTSFVHQVDSTLGGDILISTTGLMARATFDESKSWSLHSFKESKNSQLMGGLYHLVLDGDDVIVKNPTRAGRMHQDEWREWEPFERGPGHYFHLQSGVLLRHTRTGQIDRWVNPQWEPDRRLTSPLHDYVLQGQEQADRSLHLILEDGCVVAITIDGKQTDLVTAVDPDLGSLVAARFFSDGGFVTASNNSTVRIWDGDWQEAARINSASGLPSGHLNDLFIDQSATVWGAVGGQIDLTLQPLQWLGYTCGARPGPP